MRAARWYAPRDVRIESVPQPQPGSGEVVVRVEWCGLCGTDLHEYTHGPVLIPSRPHPLTGRLPPITLGHEFSGTVAAAGAGAAFREGDRVTANACLVCHECSWCRAGQFNLCAKLGSIGLCADGGFAELVRVPAYALHRVPANAVDKEIAAATDNRRADVVFECTGSLAGIETALRVAGKGGRVVLVGIYRDASPAPWARLQAHEKEIIGSSAYTDEFPAALDLLASGAVQALPLITDRIRLDELESRGLRALLEEPQEHLKILVQP